MNNSQETAAMIAKAHSKLETARIDYENARFEDAVSRTYYAAFHAISAVLFSRGLTFSSHGQVLSAFNREYIKSGIFPQSFFRMTQRLYDDRQSGDYAIFSALNEESARSCIEDAATILDAIAVYLGVKE